MPSESVSSTRHADRRHLSTKIAAKRQAAMQRDRESLLGDKKEVCVCVCVCARVCVCVWLWRIKFLPYTPPPPAVQLCHLPLEPPPLNLPCSLPPGRQGEAEQGGASMRLSLRGEGAIGRHLQNGNRERDVHGRE